MFASKLLRHAYALKLYNCFQFPSAICYFRVPGDNGVPPWSPTCRLLKDVVDTYSDTESASKLFGNDFASLVFTKTYRLPAFIRHRLFSFFAKPDIQHYAEYATS